jgi:hypothetical protein
MLDRILQKIAGNNDCWKFAQATAHRQLLIIMDKNVSFAFIFTIKISQQP